MQINPGTCTVNKTALFDIVSGDSSNLVTYLASATTGSVWIGVTVDKVTNSMTTAACNALSSLGVSISDVQSGGSFSFIFQKGYSNRTVLHKSIQLTDMAATLVARVSS